MNWSRELSLPTRNLVDKVDISNSGQRLFSDPEADRKQTPQQNGEDLLFILTEPAPQNEENWFRLLEQKTTPAQKTSLPSLETRLRQAFDLVMETFNAKGEVALLLTSDTHIQELNFNHRGLNKVTNVLAFPDTFDSSDTLATSGQPGMQQECFSDKFGARLGDIALAFGKIRQEALEAGKPVENHVLHLFVHALLHLFGYDHHTHEDAQEMETLEVRLLSKLGVPDPCVSDFCEEESGSFLHTASNS